MKTIVLFITLLLSFKTVGLNPSVSASVINEASFKITYRNYHLGYIKAVKQALNTTNTYMVLGRAESDLFLKKIVSENWIYSVYEKDAFVKSATFIKRNGKTLNNTQTNLSQGKYIISTVEKTKQLLSDEIRFTVGLMYFQEPIGIRQVYAEAWGTLLPLIHDNNTYTFTIPDGTTCTFTYEKGELVEVTSKTIIGEIKFTKE